MDDNQKEKLLSILSEKRRKHTMGVRTTGRKLAEIYGADKEQVDIACIIHDLYRGKEIEELDRMIDELGIDEKYKGNANLSHGKIAAEVAKRDIGITDTEIINAVAYHTTGRADMSLVEKIVFISDAIEPGRDYPGVEELRHIAPKNIDKACFMSLSGTVAFLKKQGVADIDEDTIKAVNSLVERGKSL